MERLKGKKATDTQRDEYVVALRDGTGVPEGFVYDGRDLYHLATDAELKAAAEEPAPNEQGSTSTRGRKAE